jgi:hypothetical protein
MKTFDQFITEVKHGPRIGKAGSRQRGENLSKALQRRMRTSAPIRGGVGEYTHRTKEPDDVSTEVEVYKNPAHYAAAHSPKVTTKDGKRKVISTGERAFKANQFRKQLTKNRRKPKGKVFNVDIEPNLQRDHGDTENLRQRTKNFKSAVANVPKVIKSAGAKRGDHVVGAPGQPQGIRGIPPKAATRSRARLYTQLPGAGKLSKTTGRIVGKVE